MALSKIDTAGLAADSVDNTILDLAGDYAGIHFGGTGSANQFDDYETGTWTPTADAGLTSLSVTSAEYTKIGNTVLATFRGSVQASATSGVITFGGLPFTASANGSGIVGQGNSNFDFNGGVVVVSDTTFRMRHALTTTARTCNVSVLYHTA